MTRVRYPLYILLLSCCLLSGCSGDGGAPEAPGSSFPVVVFSDVHFNPFYDTSLFAALNSSAADAWPGIFQTSTIKAPSAWSSDTNYPALQLALTSIGRDRGNAPFIIFTGDILGHNFSETYKKLNGSEDIPAMVAFADKTVAFFMNQVRGAAGTVPVLFALGNSDSYLGLEPEGTFLSHTADLYYSQFLNGSVDRQTFLDSFTRGGYYSVEPAGTKLMVIGLNTVGFSLPGSAAAIDSELAWFEQRLLAARAADKKVWLLMHIPPGAQIGISAGRPLTNGQFANPPMMWQADSQTKFLGLLAKYPGVIVQTLAAHTHMDEYRIISPENLLEITPAITPYFGNNPAYKIFTVDSAGYKAGDVTVRNYDLAANPLQFDSYYTFSASYGVRGPLNETLRQLYPALRTDSAQQALYRGHYFSGHNYTIPVTGSQEPLTDGTWPYYWCGGGTVEAQAFMDCVNGY